MLLYYFIHIPRQTVA